MKFLSKILRYYNNIIKTPWFTVMPIKLKVDFLIAYIWQLHFLNKKKPKIDFYFPPNFNSWGLYEIALKTNFYFLDYINSIQGLLYKTKSCRNCKNLILKLLEKRRFINKKIFYSQKKCLNEWKKEMRKEIQKRMIWPKFDWTICLIKPEVSPEIKKEILKIIQFNFSIEIIEQKIKKLKNKDIFFLYSTAYGKKYISKLLNFYLNKKIDILLLKKDNIVNYQNEIKNNIRSLFNKNKYVFNNLIHFPDSLGETYSNLFYFWGENNLKQLINHECLSR